MNTQYETLLYRALRSGTQKGDRTGTGTRSVFAHQLRYRLDEGFPLITTKKIHIRSIIYELLWFLRGDTNIKFLNDNGVHIWDEWADPNGNLGPVYGYQWRHWDAGTTRREMDQIAQVMEQLKTNPDDRRMIVTAWNPSDVPYQALPPCPVLFQFYVADGKLSCHLYQRSCDLFLGVPFNIASYSLLTHMVAQQADLDVGDFIWTGGDCHIYNNHIEQAELQISRSVYPFPRLQLEKAEDIFSYKYENFDILDYQFHPHIAGEVAV